MSFDIRYDIWCLHLWGRNYGTTQQIADDVAAGKLVPGLMPDAYAIDGDRWTKESDVPAKELARLKSRNAAMAKAEGRS
jgi:hypothetical protein